MGFGGIFKQQNSIFQQQDQLMGSQNALTDESNALLLQAGKAQEDAANAEATALRQQGDMAYYQTQQNEALFQRENTITAGTEAEQYLSAGVQMIGTPMQVVNETVNLGKMRLAAMEQQGQLEQDLFYSKAGLTQNQGVQANLQDQGQAAINTMTNEINQTQTKIGQQQTLLQDQQAEQNMYSGMFGGLEQGALSILEPVGHAIGHKFFPNLFP